MNGERAAAREATEGILGRYRGIVDDPAAFLDVAGRPLPGYIWTNPLKVAPERLREILAADGYRLSPVPWQPGAFRVSDYRGGLGNHWAYFAGLFHIQEASSMLPAVALGAQPGERVLDLCAAPGNKTAQIALGLGNRGTVAANDISQGRIKALSANLNRLGCLNTTITCWDGASYPRGAGRFDCVLVDAPCSCEGTSRRHPDITERPFQALEKPINRQTLLLHQAFRRCRPGGRILYSTCTYAPEENEAVVDHLLRSFPGEADLLPIRVPGFHIGPGLDGWEGRRFSSAMARAARIWPHHNDTGGFFMALIGKRGRGAEEGEGEPAADFPADLEAGGNADAVRQVLDRFGIALSALGEMRVLIHRRRTAYLVAGDHHPPAVPDRVIGLPLVRISRSFQKLTTSAATALGHLAARNIVDLDGTQVSAYLTRTPVVLDGAGAAGCTRGHVMVRHAGVVLGMGEYRADRGILYSMFPKHWADHLKRVESRAAGKDRRHPLAHDSAE